MDHMIKLLVRKSEGKEIVFLFVSVPWPLACLFLFLIGNYMDYKHALLGIRYSAIQAVLMQSLVCGVFAVGLYNIWRLSF